MRPPTSAVIALLALLPTGGCCTISQGLSALFCGPRPAQPRRSYLTPARALDTFVAAVASDDSKTIWESVGPRLKQDYGIGRFEWEIGWNRIKAEIFGIHLIDQASRSGPETLPPAPPQRPHPLVRYRLELAGNRIEVLLRQHSYWEVITLLEDTTEPEAASRFVPDASELIGVRTVDDKVEVALRIPGPDWAPLNTEVLSARVTREWLIEGFAVLPPR